MAVKKKSNINTVVKSNNAPKTPDALKGANIKEKSKTTSATSTDRAKQMQYISALAAIDAQYSAVAAQYPSFSDRDSRYARDDARRKRDDAIKRLNSQYGFESNTRDNSRSGFETTTDTTTTKYRIGGKTFNSKEEAQSYIRETNKANGYVWRPKQGGWVQPKAKPAAGGGGKQTLPGDNTTVREEAVVPEGSETKADPVMGGDGAGQVDAPVGGGNIAGIPDAELVEKGQLPAEKAVNPQQTVNALDQYKAQLDSAYGDWTTDMDVAIAQALQNNTSENKRGAGYYSNKFLDPYLDPYKTTAGTATTVSDDPNAVYNFKNTFNDEAIQAVLDAINADEISNYKNLFNDKGFGYDETSGTSKYATNTFSDKLDDAWITDILDTQGGLAKNALDRALSYGQIGQGGWDYAMGELGNQRTAGSGALNEIGSGLLGGYKSATDEAIGNAYGDIEGLGFGSKYNVNQNANKIRGDANTALSGFEGEFRQGVGDSQYFDIASLLSQASKGSGLFDPIKEGTAGGFYQALEDRERKRGQSRGLGSQGSF